MNDKKLCSMEAEILELERELETKEEELLKRNQEVAADLVQYSQKYSKHFPKKLAEWEEQEKTVHADYYSLLSTLNDRKQAWRHRFVGLMRKELSEKTNSKFTPSANQSKLLKKIVDGDHPAALENDSAQKKSEEGGFGPFELAVNEIAIYSNKPLGSGAFGVVHRGVCRGKEVAVKTLKNVQFDPKMVEEFKRECIIMRSSPHPNILLFMGACLVPGHYKIVTELATQGSLDKILSQKQVKLSFLRKIRMAQEIAEGVSWLHGMQPPLLHLDLKPANLLLMDDFTVKIADFGMSRLKRSVDDKKQEEAPVGPAVGGTPLYMPPEMFSLNPVPTEKCDVYAYGIILWELITEKSPYEGKYRSLAQLTQAVCMGERPEIPPTIPTTLVKVIKSCWDQNPAERPMYSTIIAPESGTFNAVIREAISAGESMIAKFWEQFGTNKDGRTVEDVEWEKFKRAFCVMMNVDESARSNDLNAVAALLAADGKNGKVTLANFQHFARWFKPLRPCSGADLSTLDEVKQLVSAPWFWGEMDSAGAAQALQGGKRGNFLVRFSASGEGQFTVSYLAKNPKGKGDIVSHTRLSQALTQTIPAVVKEFCKKTKLKTPHPGRPSKFVVLYGKSGGQISAEVAESAQNYVGHIPNVSDDGVFSIADEYTWDFYAKAVQ